MTGVPAGTARSGRFDSIWVSTQSCSPSLANMALERPSTVRSTPRRTLASPSAETAAMRSGVRPAATSVAVSAPADAPATLPNQRRRAATARRAPA